jgi:MOSC domain-containing protein YiiM
MEDAVAEHRTLGELEAGLAEIRRSPAERGEVRQIVVRPERGERQLPAAGELTPAAGLVGDRWARHNDRRLPDGRVNPDTQITLMNARAAALIAGPADRWPLAGDNLVVDLDLSLANLPPGARVRVGEAVLEISAEPHTGCAKFAKRFGPPALKFVNSPEGRALRLRGVNATVVRAGPVRVGDPIRKLPPG